MSPAGVPTYRHPVLAGDYPDPSVVRVGNDYWMTHSSFNYAPGLLLWHSVNLVDWNPAGHALRCYDGDVWAPDLVFHGGRYYLYYRTTGGVHAIAADAPGGPWSEPVDLGLAGFIDPGHVADPGGARFLHLSEGWMVGLQSDGLGLRGEPRKVLEPFPIDPDRSCEGVFLEGPKLLWRNGWCHLLAAQGGTAGPAVGHMVVHARSRSVDGPWEYSPHNPLISAESRNDPWWSRGHGSLIEGPDGQWYCFYHAYAKGFHTLGRQTLMERVCWTDDDWLRLPDNRELDQPMTAPAARQTAVSGENSWEDSFAGSASLWRWRFWSGEMVDRCRIPPEGGLEINARGSDIPGCGPMACIPQHQRYTVEAELEVTDGATAGLILFYNEACYGGLSFDGQSVRLVGARMFGRHVMNVEGSGIAIRLVNDAHEVQLWVRSTPGEWKRLPHTLYAEAWHHGAFGQFLSLRPAVFALGESGGVILRRFRYAAADGS